LQEIQAALHDIAHAQLEMQKIESLSAWARLATVNNFWLSDVALLQIREMAGWESQVDSDTRTLINDNDDPEEEDVYFENSSSPRFYFFNSTLQKVFVMTSMRITASILHVCM
jgi:hypothetical protein